MKIGVILTAVVLLLFGAECAAARDGIDRTPVASLELERYMGTWYEIARYDHSFERGLCRVRVHYRMLPGGRIRVVGEGVKYRTGARRSVRGKARTALTPGCLRVSFFWFFYSDYLVLELGENYQWALVGGRSADRLWILSRTPDMPGRTLNRILRLAQKRGYSTGKLLYVARE